MQNNYYKKYLKYKEKYINLKFKNQYGGFLNIMPNLIDIFNNESLIPTDKCEILKDIKMVPQHDNPGSKNIGVGYINNYIDNGEEKNIFFKFTNSTSIDEFRGGYAISLLKDKYPFFADIHGIIKCKSPINPDENAYVLISEFIKSYMVSQYFHTRIYEYLNNLFIDNIGISYEDYVNEIDQIIETHFVENNVLLQYYNSVYVVEPDIYLELIKNDTKYYDINIYKNENLIETLKFDTSQLWGSEGLPKVDEEELLKLLGLNKKKLLFDAFKENNTYSLTRYFNGINKYYKTENFNSIKSNLNFKKDLDKKINDFNANKKVGLAKIKSNLENEFLEILINNTETFNRQIEMLAFIFNAYFDYQYVDIKSDNLMVKIIPVTDKNKHIYTTTFTLNNKTYKLNNRLKWGKTEEFIYIFPIDFGGLHKHDLFKTDLSKPLIPNISINSDNVFDKINGRLKNMRPFIYSDIIGNYISTKLGYNNIRNLKKMCYKFDVYDSRINLYMTKFTDFSNDLDLKINFNYPFKYDFIKYDWTKQPSLEFLNPELGIDLKNIKNLSDIVDIIFVLLDGSTPFYNGSEWISTNDNKFNIFTLNGVKHTIKETGETENFIF